MFKWNYYGILCESDASLHIKESVHKIQIITKILDKNENIDTIFAIIAVMQRK